MQAGKESFLLAKKLLFLVNKHMSGIKLYSRSQEYLPALQY